VSNYPVAEDREIVIRLPYSQFCIMFAKLQTGPFNEVYDVVGAVSAQLNPQLDAWQRALQAEQAVAESAATDTRQQH
jgi:hypothetical protein